MKKLFTAILFLALAIPVVSASKYNSRNIKADEYTKMVEQKKQKNKELIRSFNESRNNPDFISDVTIDKADSLVSYSNYDTTLYRFSYDEAGRLAGFVEIKKEEGVWTNDYKRTYVYYPSGKLKIQQNAQWKNGAWEERQKISYTYDDYGFTATILYERLGVSGWSNVFFLTTAYTPNGLLLSELAQAWVGDHWENDTREVNTYNSLGLKIAATYESWYGKWVLEYSAENTYTEWGELLVSFFTNYSTDGTKTIRKNTNSYNAERLLIRELFESLIDSVYIITSRINYQYEMNNRVVRSIHEIRISDSVVNNYCEVDTLDSNDRILINYHYNWDSVKWIPAQRNYFSYNSKGNMLKQIDFVFANDNWYKSTEEDYTYSQNDELLLAFTGRYWENGSPVAGVSFINVNIDSYVLGYLSLTCNDMKIYYKKVVIPVELTSFAGIVEGSSVLLKWQTATETNNKGFEVERKNADNNWTKIGFVQGKGTTVQKADYSFTDKSLNAGKFIFRLKQIDFDGSFTYSKEIEINSVNITEYRLEQNYPNPFNPSTVINYKLPFESKVKVNIYNTTGQLIKELVNGVKDAGAYNIIFDASQLSSGVYFYTIDASQLNGRKSFRNSRKMILVK